MNYTTRHPKRPGHKRCTKCGRVGYYRQGTRHCRFQKFGVGSYCCWGDLVSLRKPRSKTVPHVGDRFRKRAVNRLTRAKQTLRRWQARLKRDQTLVHKWELRVASLDRKAQYTDEQVAALRQRAMHAAHVRKVRRRLLSAAEKGDQII